MHKSFTRKTRINTFRALTEHLIKISLICKHILHMVSPSQNLLPDHCTSKPERIGGQSKQI